MTELARLKWACRRGMKELDVLLEHYLEHEFPSASPQLQAAFRAVLELDDPVLWYYVMERDRPQDEDMQRVIQALIKTLQH